MSIRSERTNRMWTIVSRKINFATYNHHQTSRRQTEMVSYIRVAIANGEGRERERKRIPPETKYCPFICLYYSTMSLMILYLVYRNCIYTHLLAPNHIC